MQKHLSSREKILAAFGRLIEKVPFSSIRVTMVSEEANVSQQTFYRLYDNKYDLATHFFENQLFAAVTLCGKRSTIKEIMMAILLIIRNNSRMFTNLMCDDEGARLFPEILKKISLEWTGFSPAWATTIINTQILIEWASKRFSDPPEAVYYRYISSLPAYELLSKEELAKKIREYESLQDKDFAQRKHDRIHANDKNA